MNRSRLFWASCVALVTTSMVFSIRGDILDALGADFHLTNQQLGVVLGPAFWGFTVSILIGGSLVDFVGMRRLFLISCAGYIIAPSLIIFAPTPAGPVDPYYSDPGFLVLYGGMLILGLSQGLVEGVINPLTATMYPEEKTHKLSILHAWWPGGLIIGGLLAYLMTKLMALDSPSTGPQWATLGWQLKIGLLVVPAVIYGAMVFKEDFPSTERVEAGVPSKEMFMEGLRPMFLLWFGLMWLTASTELGPDQWVASLITDLTGMRGILILSYTAGIMFVLRFFGGKLADRFSPLGLLALSSVFSAIGLFALGLVSTPSQAFLAATIFGVGKAFFWPTMLGVTAEQFPKGGAFALAMMGGVGQLSVAFILPLMGSWYDQYGASAAFHYVAVIPVFLTVIFTILFFYYKSQGGYKVVRLEEHDEIPY